MKTALCCIADDAVFHRVQHAASAARLRPVRIPTESLLVSAQEDVVVLIYDLSHPAPEVATDVVRTWHGLHPRHPVLLYHPATIAAAALIGQLTPLPGISARIQMPGLADEERQLARQLSELVSRGPELLVRAVLNVVRPTASAPIRVFVEALIEELARKRAGAPEVRAIAARGNLKPWVVRRECRAANLPPPERLVGWLTLIYVVALAAWEHLSIVEAAAKAGVTDRHIRKLRATLLPEIERLTGTRAPAVLPQVIARFAEASGLSSERAAVAAEKLTT